MNYSCDDDQAGWILAGLKLVIAANVDNAKFDVIERIANYGKQFEEHLNQVVLNGQKERQKPSVLGRV
jgi:hypothetical protein